jgi:hypothetical protein
MDMDITGFTFGAATSYQHINTDKRKSTPPLSSTDAPIPKPTKTFARPKQSWGSRQPINEGDGFGQRMNFEVRCATFLVSTYN